MIQICTPFFQYGFNKSALDGVQRFFAKITELNTSYSEVGITNVALPLILIGIESLTLQREDIEQKFRSYVPEKVAVAFADWVLAKRILVKITPERKSKLGDYRHPYKQHGHRISINGSLNRYAFMITFLHELAHLLTWEKHKNKVAPHGLEWKYSFQKLMLPYLQSSVFPKDVRMALSEYMKNPAAATCRDERLYKTLKRYDANSANVILLDELPVGQIFEMENGRVFRKEHKLRKYIRCVELATMKQFRVPALVEVKPLALTKKEKDRFASVQEGWEEIGKLSPRAHFQTKEGLRLTKVRLLRKNYLCREIGTERMFKVPAHVLVKKL